MADDLWRFGERDTIPGILQRAARNWPDREYLDFAGVKYTYGWVDAESNRLAHGLASLGVRHGDRVITLLDNTIDVILTIFAITKLGAVNVPVNTAFKGEFLRHQMADADGAVVIAEQDYAERVIAIAQGLPTLTTLLHRGEAPSEATSLKVAALDAYKLADVSPPDVVVKPTDLAQLIYTGGTTGPSKGCMMNHNYACNLTRQILNMGRYVESDVIWSPMPMFHMNGISNVVLAAASIGARAAIYPRFSLSRFWGEIERTGATVVNILGSMIPLIAEAPDSEEAKRCFGQIRVIIGAPFPPVIREKWTSRFGVKYMGSGYGFTEAAIMTGWPLDQPFPPGASGKANDDFDVRIVDDEGNELPAGQSGEIICRPRRPDVMFDGYWNRPADTLKVIRNLWLYTGDIGKFDEEGFFYFVDRKKDYLRRRGENISSYELEKTFQGHPAVKDVAVHAVKAKVGEDDVKVTLVLNEDAVITEEEMCAWSVGQLPYFAVPRYIEFREELPRSPVGKILKYQLRDEGKTPTTWDREDTDFELQKR